MDSVCIGHLEKVLLYCIYFNFLKKCVFYGKHLPKVFILLKIQKIFFFSKAKKKKNLITLKRNIRTRREKMKMKMKSKIKPHLKSIFENFLLFKNYLILQKKEKFPKKEMKLLNYYSWIN